MWISFLPPKNDFFISLFFPVLLQDLYFLIFLLFATTDFFACYFKQSSKNLSLMITLSASLLLFLSLSLSPPLCSKSGRQVWTNFSILPLAGECSISDPPPSPGCFKGKALLSSVKIIRNIGGGGQLCLDIITLHQKKLSSSSMREKSASS